MAELDHPLWRPSSERENASHLARFRAAVARHHGVTCESYAALHRWSVDNPASFWSLVWSECELIGTPGERALEPAPNSHRRVRWFPDARLNFAENLLRGEAGRCALIAVREDGTRIERSLGELRDEVASWAACLRGCGVEAGDRVVAWIGNGCEAVAAMLGAASIGATWSSCSPDFGARGVLDRFQPLEPKVLIALDGYRYGGKTFDLRAKLAEVRAELPSLRGTIVVPWLERERALPEGAEWLDEWMRPVRFTAEFERFPFDHPLYVMFSSGTTGRPKCIVHGAGGTLLQHAKEHRLQCDIHRGERVFFYTTCGWMMWNWLVSALAVETTLVLYDGSPFQPPAALLELAARESVAFFGVSAKLIDQYRRDDLLRGRSWPELRTVASTGSPLSSENFDYVYDACGDVHLASISGGTDILSCFVGGDPSGAVWRGEIQAPGLGMDVDVFDERGASLARSAGELVCRPPFPSMPLGFWGDPDADAFSRAYFERFPGWWCHGDWIERTSHGGFVIHGRSDATLNVNGVRIGTAEIYAVLDELPEVLESVAVESLLPNREGLVVLVRLRDSSQLDPALSARIRSHLRDRMSPRHVPRFLFAVSDLPRTRSGKLSEIAVRDTLHGRVARNRDALSNPGALQDVANLRWE